MFNESLEELAKKIAACLPEGLKKSKEDFEEKCKELLQVTFDKLHLVTREEFEVQVKVLERTRAKVQELEEKLKNLNNSE